MNDDRLDIAEARDIAATLTGMGVNAMSEYKDGWTWLHVNGREVISFNTRASLTAFILGIEAAGRTLPGTLHAFLGRTI